MILSQVTDSSGNVRGRMESEYLIFRRRSVASGKTKLFIVKAERTNAYLGSIKWYGPWRQYAFVPRPDTVFNHGCLHDINVVLKALMDERKKKRKAA